MNANQRPCSHCKGSGTEAELPDQVREYLNDQVRAGFLATHQHMLINSLEIAAIHATDPALRDHYAKAATELKELPCPECPS